jgi:hypothetical protein
MKKMRTNLIALISGVGVAFLLAGCGTQNLPGNMATADQLEAGQVADPRKDGNNGPLDGIWRRVSTQCVSSVQNSGLSDNFIYINNTTGYIVQEYTTGSRPSAIMNLQISYRPGTSMNAFTGSSLTGVNIGTAATLAQGSGTLTPTGENYCKLPNNSNCNWAFSYPIPGTVNFQYNLDNQNTLTVAYVNDFVCVSGGQSIVKYSLIPGK